MYGRFGLTDTIKALVLILAWLAACSGCSGGPKALGLDAPPDRVPAIAGEYAINGIDPTGIEYGGRLKISPGEQAGEYRLEWLISGGPQAGTGKLNGNQLLADWHSLAVQGRIEQNGTVTYTVTVNGELFGAKRMEGYTQAGTETAYPNSPENMSK